jgi:hypothetical protein
MRWTIIVECVGEAIKLGHYPKSLRPLQVKEGSQVALPCSALPATLQLKLAFVIERIHDQPQL